MLINNMKSITMSPGGQNILIEKIINHFRDQFSPNGKIIYLGDTDEKFAYFDEPALLELGIRIGIHGKMPRCYNAFSTSKLVSFN